MVNTFLEKRFELFVIVVVGIALIGCAEETEQLLSAAGFEAKVADTPEKLAHLQTMTQRKLVRHTKDGKNYYVYADAKRQCLFVGDEAAYQKFQNLQVQQQIADENQMAAMENREATMRWEIWGPWRRF